MELPHGTECEAHPQQKLEIASDAIYIYDWSMKLISEGSLIFHFIETIFHLWNDDV